MFLPSQCGIVQKTVLMLCFFSCTYTYTYTFLGENRKKTTLYIVNWYFISIYQTGLGVGIMRQFVLKWIRTVVGPPLPTRNLGSLALHCWAWRVRALWPTFVLGGRKSEARWGHLHPHRLSNLGLMNSLEDTVQACAWPRSGLSSLLVELLAGSNTHNTFSCDLPNIDWSNLYLREDCKTKLAFHGLWFKEVLKLKWL